MVLCGDNQESISCAAASADGCLHFHTQPPSTQSSARNFTNFPPNWILQISTFAHFHVLHLIFLHLYVAHLANRCLHFHSQQSRNFPQQTEFPSFHQHRAEEAFGGLEMRGCNFQKQQTLDFLGVCLVETII